MEEYKHPCQAISKMFLIVVVIPPRLTGDNPFDKLNGSEKLAIFTCFILVILIVLWANDFFKRK